MIGCTSYFAASVPFKVSLRHVNSSWTYSNSTLVSEAASMVSDQEELELSGAGQKM